jgi:glutamate synthase (NADPH) large chain
MFLIDLDQGRIIDDSELKETCRGRSHTRTGSRINIKLDGLEAPSGAGLQSVGIAARSAAGVRLQPGGHQVHSRADVQDGEEATGSMGNDSPLAVLSSKNKPLYNYFRQLFAQVTNPPIDPIREQMVMSLVSFIGPKPNLLGINEINPPYRLEVTQPVLTFADMAKLRNIATSTDDKFPFGRTRYLLPAGLGQGRRRSAPRFAVRRSRGCRTSRLWTADRLRSQARQGSRGDSSTAGLSAVHQHLVTQGLRTRVGLVVETGSARETHHFALLAGYGAEAVHPYLALETIEQMAGSDKERREKAIKHFVKGVGKGLLKVMSKMGISTYMSYTGAQIFEAIGLQKKMVDKYFHRHVDAGRGHRRVRGDGRIDPPAQAGLRG